MPRKMHRGRCGNAQGAKGSGKAGRGWAGRGAGNCANAAPRPGSDSDPELLEARAADLRRELAEVESRLSSLKESAT